MRGVDAADGRVESLAHPHDPPIMNAPISKCAAEEPVSLSGLFRPRGDDLGTRLFGLEAYSNLHKSDLFHGATGRLEHPARGLGKA
jgi:hypothetical protein